MATAQVEAPNPEAEEILAWRLEQLLSAGYEAADASELAHQLEVDLHQAVDLLRRGCPPVLAVAILR